MSGCSAMTQTAERQTTGTEGQGEEPRTDRHGVNVTVRLKPNFCPPPVVLGALRAGYNNFGSNLFFLLQEKFPSIVSLPEGCGSEVMTLNHPELPGCCFFIYWCVDVSTGGAVTPKIQLLSKIPEKALQLFPSQPAGGGAAEAFQSLLRILGTEAAIESIIRAVSLSESDELSN
ncbi:PREDICTED: centromere protein P-like [Poecilia mexicana]|uniref:centromere protein P-like n=1 Tax=Poecilia mexicana TaxID=48701 RepID=UPI00072E6790|nr:PREDICTED: centromere protein P-like [Poecilia mexicana]